MTMINKLLISSLFAVCTMFIYAIAAPSYAQAKDIYVATTGNDNNAGTSAAPYQTIQRAFNVVNAGDRIVIRNGTYAKAELSRAGTSSAWITVEAENPGQAKIVNPTAANVGGGIYVYSSSAFTIFKGLDISGGQHAFSLEEGVNDIKFIGNNFHDIGKICTDTHFGQTGIYMEAVQNITIEGNIFNNIGRLFLGENGCNINNVNHDHGIYINGSTNVNIQNNIFTNVSRGWAIQFYSSEDYLSSNINVLNNVFAGGNPDRDGFIVLAGRISNSNITNNIFYEGRTSGVGLSSPMTFSNVLLRNNIIKGGTMLPRAQEGAIATNNLENTDPMVVNASTRDFHLRTGSPAINAGMTLSGVTTDFDGRTRPQGSAYDIGAYEFASTAVTTPSPSPFPSPTPTRSPSPTPAPTPRPGDANGDRMTNGQDYIIWLNNYNKTLTGASNGDFNSSGKVEGSDYIIWLNNYQN